MWKNRNTWFGLMASALLLAGCGGGDSASLRDEVESVQQESAQQSPAAEAPEESERQSIFITPSPLMVASLFHESGVGFKSSHLAGFDPLEVLGSKPEKSLALGTYTTDLAYCVVNGETEKAVDYLKAVKMLSDGVGLSPAFESMNVFDRFEENVANQDTIVDLVYLIQELTNEYLAETDREDQMVIFFIGSWTEGLHIALTERKAGNKKLDKRIGEQLEMVSSLMDAMKPHAAENVLYEKIHTKLSSIKDLLPKPDPALENRRQRIVLSDEDAKALASSIEDIRKLILKV